MKYTSIALSAFAVLLGGCAGTKVTQTQVATGAQDPVAIYIRPFAVGEFKGSHGDAGRALRESQAPIAFAKTLKEELERIAPTIVLADDEVAPTGWLVEGELQLVDGGSRTGRALLGHLGVGRSGIIAHVVVKDVNGNHAADGKSGRGNTLYEFDVAGGSRINGRLGSIKAGGIGTATPFDYRNASETIYHALTPDAHRYGTRSTLTIRQ